MASKSPFRSPAVILVVVVMMAVAFSIRRQMSGGGGDSPPTAAPECEGLTQDECLAQQALGGMDDVGVQGGMSGEGRPTGVILSASETCTNVGYLCAEVAQTGRLQILRWPEDTPRIRIWVPRPTGVSAAKARDLQRAAVLGIQAWDGHPFPFAVRTRERGEVPDVTVEWVRTLGGNRLGRAQIEWVRQGEEISLQVRSLVLVTHYPNGGGLELTPEQIRLVAAHEMGHALGLPHSDNTRDLMYPENSATSLSTRDYRTLEALYSLPNGAEIRR